MSMLTVAVVLQTAMVATGADDYLTAHQTIVETGKPMVVMVGADWCPACQTMKKTAIPRIRERGLLRKVAFAVVNLDRDKELGQELTNGGPIPQLIMYRKTADGWRRKVLVGNQTVETIETFINEGVALNDAEHQSHPAATAHKPEAEKPQAPGPKVERSASHATGEEAARQG